MLDLKYSNYEKNIFSLISSLATEHNAINLADSFPNMPLSDKLKEAVTRNIISSTNGFAPVYGLLSLREKVSHKIETLYSKHYSAENEITISAGYTQALFAAISSMVRENDEVILFEPSHDNYVAAIEVNGGRPVFVPLKEPDFHIDWDEVQKMVTPKTKMIIINSPHNPTGSLLTELDMLRLQKLINGTKIVVLSDELFDHMIYDDAQHQSVALYPKLAENSIIVSSLAESQFVPCWQLGYCIAPANLMKEIRKYQQIMVYSVNSLMQQAFNELTFEKEEFRKIKATFQAKRDRLVHGIENSRFNIIATQSSYFQLISYKDISAESDKDFAIRLIKENGIATLPISAFYHEKSKKSALRLNFAQSDEVLDKAIERLKMV